MKVHTDNQAEVFKRWLSDGETWIGVFQNQALDSSNRGHRFALSFDMENFGEAEVGKTCAPDTSFGLGWKYILIAKCLTVEEAVASMKEEPDDSPTS